MISITTDWSTNIHETWSDYKVRAHHAYWGTGDALELNTALGPAGHSSLQKAHWTTHRGGRKDRG